MDYEQDEQEEQFEEHTAEPQAKDMEIDEDDAPYLDLRDDREHQAYTMIKNQSFSHTRAFELQMTEYYKRELEMNPYQNSRATPATRTLLDFS